MDRLFQVGFYARDPERLAGWYRETFGLVHSLDTGDMVFLFDGNLRIMFGPGDAETSNSILYFETDDFEATRQRLLDSGSEALQEAAKIQELPEGELWLAIYRDPEGNPVGVFYVEG